MGQNEANAVDYMAHAYPADPPTMADIVRALRESFDDDAVATVLGTEQRRLFGGGPVITHCTTAAGRRDVYAWAYSLGEMIAT
jgi:hypothetical protein